MAGGALGEEGDRAVGDNAHAIVPPPFQEHLRKHGEIGRGAEQPRVPSHPTQRPGVLVVDFTAQRVAARRGDFRGRRPEDVFQRHAVMRVPHPQLGKYFPLEKDIKRLTTHRFGHEAQQVGAKVGILVAVAGGALNGRRQHGGACVGRRLRHAPQFAPGR